MDLKKIHESLNDFRYTEIIPSMEGKKIEMRPYVVGDQFRISQAQLSEDYEIIMKTCFDLVVQKCNLTPDIANKITLIDVQYLLKKLKMISDDETIKVKITCPECQFQKSETLLLQDIEIVNYENFEKTIFIGEDVAIKLRTPSFKKNEKIILGKEESLEVSMKQALLNCIDSITQGDEIKTDFDTKELEDFILNLPQKFLNEFNDFIRNEPTLKLNRKIKCASCGHEIEIGLQHFFFLLV